MREAIERELRVAFSKQAQPAWFRVVKWTVFLGMCMRLRGTGRLRPWVLGMSIAGLSVHLFYRWKTETWTRPWGGWDDVGAGRGETPQGGG